ncbi:MAG: nuclear transport factor 2 family protein [Beijerinckiaceae bacterium]
MPNSDFAFDIDILDRTAVDSLIRSFWSMRLENAERAIQTYCTESIEFSIAGDTGASQSSLRFCGMDAVIEAVRNLDTNLKFTHFSIVDLLIDGHEAALRWLGCFEHRGTGAVGCFSVFDHIVIKDGKIDSYFEFLDTEGFNKLMAGHPQPLLGLKSNGLPVQTPANDDSVYSERAYPTDMIMRNNRVRQLRNYWAQRLLRGGNAMTDFFTDDCELHFVGDAAAIPFARFHKGLDAARNLSNLIDVEFEYLGFDIHRILVDGDRAAVRWCAYVRHRGTSAGGVIQALDHVIFRKDRIFFSHKVFRYSRHCSLDRRIKLRTVQAGCYFIPASTADIRPPALNCGLDGRSPSARSHAYTGMSCFRC